MKTMTPVALFFIFRLLVQILFRIPLPIQDRPRKCYATSFLAKTTAALALSL